MSPHLRNAALTRNGFQSDPLPGDLTGALSVENLVYPRGLGAPPRLERISFALAAGECLAILGESGSGKTTLLHAMCGSDPAPIGAVRLDETDIRTLAQITRDRSIGYLPQQASLMPGTIAENIFSFAPDNDDDKIVAAARLAGVHGLISSLPKAYQTDLQVEPHLLSAGQKQRLALARAIYQQPKFLFLDEPNALLDAEGERMLFDALSRLKSAGCTIIMVIHRAGIMGLADKVLVMDRGKLADFGPKTEVLGRMGAGQRQLRLPITAAALQDLSDWVSRQFHRSDDMDFQNRAVLVATELYNFARQNGPSSTNRLLTFDFTFQDDQNCTLRLSEPRRTQLTEKIRKIRKHVANPAISFLDLATDELALAMILQLSSDFQLKTGPKSSEYVVALQAVAGRGETYVH